MIPPRRNYIKKKYMRRRDTKKKEIIYGKGIIKKSGYMGKGTKYMEKVLNRKRII